MTCWEEMSYLRHLLTNLRTMSYLLTKLNSYSSLAQQLRGTKHLTCIHKVLGSNSMDLIPLSVGSVKYNKQSLLSPTVNVASFPGSSPAFVTYCTVCNKKLGRSLGLRLASLMMSSLKLFHHHCTYTFKCVQESS